MPDLLRLLLLAGGLSIASLLAASPRPGADASPAPAAQGGQGVPMLAIDGGIGPATRDYIKRQLARAEDSGAPALILRIDTPGGLDAATRDINRLILAADVPVIAWVAPDGARAASAGTYIVYASHLAAMAPATSLGAATPVALGGMPGRGRDDAPPRERDGGDGRAGEGDGSTPDAQQPPPPRERDGDAATRKAVNDAVAYLRSLAELRGRDAEFAEAAVREAATLTAAQALQRGVVEIVARDADALLRQADGRTVRLGEREVTLATAGRTVTTIEPDWRSRLLSVITDPTVAYLLLLVGLYGLLFEGYSPGAIVPGVVGGISLLLALYALQVLPVNYVGVALIVLGVALMAAELFAPSFGALGIGGLVALVAGSLVLFDTEVPGFAVSLRVIAGIAVASALAFMAMLWLALRARRRPVVTGAEELIGASAQALEDFHGRGRVRVHGEVWQADSALPVRAGDAVRVLAIDGLVLRVAPAVDGPRPLASPNGDPP